MGINISQKKLRIGIILENENIPAWIHSLIQNIYVSPYCEQPFIFLTENSPRIKFKKLYYAIYSFAKKKEKTKKDALAIVSPDLITEKLDTTRIQANYFGNNFELSEPDVKKMTSRNPDVILYLGCFHPSGKILQIPEKGLWTFGFLAKRKKTGLTDGFVEMITFRNTTEISLNCASSEHSYIYRSHMQSHPFSIPKNRNRMLWKSAAMAVQFLNKLHLNGREIFLNNANTGNTEGDIESWNSLVFGRVLLYLFFLIKYGFIKKIYKEQWILLFKRSQKRDIDLPTFQKILPPKDRFWADPHIIFRDNKHYIFVEELLFKKKKAHISFLTLDAENRISKPEKILEKECHLSYPFIFEWQDELYMIPETSGNKTIEIYRCTEFPDKWEFYKYLMQDIAAGDVTLFFHNKLWWLFANIALIDGYPNWDDLYLFYSDSPLSENWTAHPMNPVVSDVSRSRPAGRIYTENDIIYRPSQDSSLRYGYGININQVIRLNEKEYSEKTVKKILPDWHKNIKRVHTINHNTHLTIADAKRNFLKFF